MVSLSPLLRTRCISQGLGRALLQSRRTLTWVTMPQHRNNYNNNNNNNSNTRTTHCKSIHTTLQCCNELPTVERRFNLSFEEFAKERKNLVKWQRMTGAVIGLIGGYGSSFVVFVNYPECFLPPENPTDELPMIFGYEPMMVTVAFSAVGMVAGFAVGSVLLKLLWSQMLYREKMRHIKEREKDFLSRLAEYRAPDSAMRTDFYGDKIENLSDYRQWLRRQQRNREKIVEMEAEGGLDYAKFKEQHSVDLKDDFQKWKKGDMKD